MLHLFVFGNKKIKNRRYSLFSVVDFSKYIQKLPGYWKVVSKESGKYYNKTVIGRWFLDSSYNVK